MPQGHGQLRSGITPRAAARKAHPTLQERGGEHAAGESLPRPRPSSCRPALRLRRSSRGRSTPEIRLFRKRRVLQSHPGGRPWRRDAWLSPRRSDVPRPPPRRTSSGAKHSPSKNVDALPPKIREERVVNRKGRRIVRLRRVSLSGPTSFSACRPGVPEPLQAYPSSWQSAGGCTGFPAP